MKWLRAVARRLLPDPPPPRADASVSRRELITGSFLAGLFGEAPSAPASKAPTVAKAAVPVIRPPGAVPEPDFLAGCTRCGDCLSACPHQAIVLAPERLRSAAGTPIIEPIGQPCLMCADTPCITACKPAVLRRTVGEPVPAIGIARISTVDCLAHQGTTCSSCRERCPVDGAIALTGQRPQVVADRCTGCGICHHVCLAPRNAVLLMPRKRG